MSDNKQPFGLSENLMVVPEGAAQPEVKPEPWRKAGKLFTDPPESCDECDSKEFILSGPIHVECYRCSLVRESDWLRSELERVKQKRDEAFSNGYREGLTQKQVDAQLDSQRADFAESQLSTMREALEKVAYMILDPTLPLEEFVKKTTKLVSEALASLNGE